MTPGPRLGVGVGILTSGTITEVANVPGHPHDIMFIDTANMQRFGDQWLIETIGMMVKVPLQYDICVGDVVQWHKNYIYWTSGEVLRKGVPRPGSKKGIDFDVPIPLASKVGVRYPKRKIYD